MTTANKISVFRILLVPVFVGALLYYFESREEVHRYLAMAVFALAAASDGVDGYIARRFNQRTELGTILDPIGDKLLLVAGMVLLTLPGPQGVSPLPLWLAVTAISRDLLLLLGAGVLRWVHLKAVFRPHWTGKLATVLQIGCIACALLALRGDGLRVLAFAAAVATAASGMFYVRDFIRQMSTAPACAPSRDDGVAL